MKKILIIGGANGLGSSLCKHFSGFDIHATFRKNYVDVDGVIWHFLDLSMPPNDFIRSLQEQNLVFDIILFVAAHTPNAVIDDVGVTFGNGLQQEKFKTYFEINTIAPLIIFEKLYSNNCIAQNATIVFFSSRAGSISLRGKLPHNVPGGNLIYRMSKAALNSGIRNIAYDLADEEITVFALHPGWVRTSSGGNKADLDVMEAGKKISDFILKSSRDYHGKFLTLDDNELEW